MECKVTDGGRHRCGDVMTFCSLATRDSSNERLKKHVHGDVLEKSACKYASRCVRAMTSWKCVRGLLSEKCCHKQHAQRVYNDRIDAEQRRRQLLFPHLIVAMLIAP
jgi:hypothetical protein